MCDQCFFFFFWANFKMANYFPYGEIEVFFLGFSVAEFQKQKCLNMPYSCIGSQKTRRMVQYFYFQMFVSSNLAKLCYG
jgi:hypothetical protein